MFRLENDTLIFERRGETVRVQAVGKNGLRVRATPCGGFQGEDWALDGATVLPADVMFEAHAATIRNGRISLTISDIGQIRIFRDGVPILREYYRMYGYDSPHTPSLRVVAREFRPVRGGDYELCLRFESNEGEKLFGMGQYQQPQLDLKGCSLELAQRNSQCSVPFALSSLGYGFLWN